MTGGGNAPADGGTDAETGVDPRLPGRDRSLGDPRPAPQGVRLAPPQPGDRGWMARALEQARTAALRGEVPVGAVLVRDGRLLAEAGNRTVSHADPTAHAEVEALRRGAARIGDWRLSGTTLYVTLEPCTQCAGALVLARVDRVVYGAADPKAGMAGSLGNLLQDPRLNHRVALTAGVLDAPSSALLREFFRARRG
jgi:tRNA(adenine34) deaminase